MVFDGYISIKKYQEPQKTIVRIKNHQYLFKTKKKFQNHQ